MDEKLKFEDLDSEEFEDMFKAYNALELEIKADLDHLSDVKEIDEPWLPTTEDLEDWGHYATAADDDSEDFGDFASKYTPEVWNIEIPQEIIDRIQEQYLNSKTGNKSYELHEYVWSEQWPNIRSEEIDPMQSAADYYLLFGIVSDAFVKYDPIKIPTFVEIQQAGRKLRKSFKEIEERQEYLKNKAENDPRAALTELKDQADKQFHELVEMLDMSFREYVHLACGGELRHHSSISPILSKYRKGSWVHWKFVFDKYGVDAIDKMADMFLEFPDTAYGGPAWADAAKILAQRERGELGPDSFTNKQLFVDRVFTLEHNGGCFLNKLSWVNKRENLSAPYNYHFESMVDTVLELHSADELNIEEMVKYASKEVADLVKRYLDLAVKSDLEIEGIWSTVKKAPKKKTEPTDPEAPSLIDWSDELNPGFKIDKDVAKAIQNKLMGSFAQSIIPVEQEGSKLHNYLEMVYKHNPYLGKGTEWQVI